MRSDHDVVRGARLTVTIDGQAVEAFDGETLASVMLAAEQRVFRLDRQGRPRGLYCNMGVCSECLVDVAIGQGASRRLRACLTSVSEGMRVVTGAAT